MIATETAVCNSFECLLALQKRWFFSQNQAVIDCLPLPTSGRAGIKTETCLEKSAESCGQSNSAVAKHVKHCVHLRNELCLSSDELPQQFSQERKDVQTEVDRMLCNQFLQIYESSPIQLWQCTGLSMVSAVNRHCLCGILSIQVINLYDFTTFIPWKRHLLRKGRKKRMRLAFRSAFCFT